MTQPDGWYSYAASAEVPELETGGIGPMAGPAYQFDAKAAKGPSTKKKKKAPAKKKAEAKKPAAKKAAAKKS